MMAVRQVPLLALVLASVGLHAAVLSLSWQSAPTPARVAGTAPRTMLLQPVALPAGPALAKWLHASTGVQPSPLADDRAPDPIGHEALPQEAPLLPVPTLQAALPDGDGPEPDDLYLPRSQLTLAPVLRSQVALVWPEQADAQGGHFRAVLALFIDEQGVVQRVRVEGGAMPPALVAVAQASFLGASFVPGELQGQVVKSLIRVEVRFDAERPTGSRGLRL